MNQLLEVIKSTQLDDSKSKVLIENFSSYYEIASEWQKKANELVVNDVSQVAEMKLAREGRLFLKEKRVLIEKTRKILKENSLKEGRAIDQIASMLTLLIEPIEQDLEQKEKFKERQEKLLKDELRFQRTELVRDFQEFIPINIDLADLTDVAFNTILTGAKSQHEAKIEAEKKLEEERLKQLAVVEFDTKRRNELRDSDLWHFLEPEQRNLNFGVMTDKYYNGLVSDLIARKRRKEEEDVRVKNTLEEFAKKQEELAELQRREAERQRIEEEERVKAEKEAKKLAKAPIKKKYKMWVESFDIPDMPVHDQVGVNIVTKFEAFKNWAKKEIDNL